MLADFALNIAAGLTQWLFEPQLDDWRRRFNDPQRNAVEKVIKNAARQMLRQVQHDLQVRRPDLGSGDYETLGKVLGDYFALPQVASAVLEAAILRRPLDLERMQTHFRTVRAPERLTGIPFVIDDCLPLFLTHLGEELNRSAREVQSPLYNFWSVLVQADTHAAVGQTLSEMQDFRLLLQQALLRMQSKYLWVNVPPKPAAPLLGRDDLFDDLVARILSGHSPALSTDGLPGVGKTALAVALAHDERVRAHFVDGVLWGGLGVNPDVVTIQNQWATALGFDLADEPDVHKRAQRLSGVVGEQRKLVVIDDAWEVAVGSAARATDSVSSMGSAPGVSGWVGPAPRERGGARDQDSGLGAGGEGATVLFPGGTWLVKARANSKKARQCVMNLLFVVRLAFCYTGESVFAVAFCRKPAAYTFVRILWHSLGQLDNHQTWRGNRWVSL